MSKLKYQDFNNKKNKEFIKFKENILNKIHDLIMQINKNKNIFQT